MEAACGMSSDIRFKVRLYKADGFDTWWCVNTVANSVCISSGVEVMPLVRWFPIIGRPLTVSWLHMLHDMLDKQHHSLRILHESFSIPSGDRAVSFDKINRQRLDERMTFYQWKIYFDDVVTTSTYEFCIRQIPK
ncbi:hypothetical protein Tco_1303538 [Tanacetum coccineum]